MNFPPILLASGSPRRRQLLTEAGFEVSFTSPDVDESVPSELPAEEIPVFLAYKKSLAVVSELLVVTADTIVSIEDEILNKPKSDKEAFEMLSKLSGKSHKVYTGVCIRKGNRTHGFVESSTVFFKTLSPEFIKTYIRKCSPFDKAGSYGIQDMMGYFGVRGIEGCYYNVMGFPMSRFYDELITFLNEED